MNRSTLLLSGLLVGISMLGLWSWLTAESNPASGIIDPGLEHSALRFVENKGQWDPGLAYLVRLRGGEMYMEENQISYFFYDTGDDHGHGHGPKGPANQTIKAHRFSMSFPGAAARPEIQPSLLAPEYHNYFIGNDPSRWAGRVSLFGQLTYDDLYPGIDMRIYGMGSDVKYDFILEAGVDPNQISIAYEGLDKLRLKDGNLVLTTSLRTVTEMAPYAYQEINGRIKEVACRYQLRKGVVSYVFPKGYDDQYSLIIDPTLVFSTYTGSFSDNWGFTATYDESGNGYGGGIQRGLSVGTGYPVTNGAYDLFFDGGTSDATIAKFSPNGNTLIYSTFLGGPPGNDNNTSYEDQPHSMIVNANDELIVFGRTNSPNFPTTSGAYDESANGGYDLFVSKFSSDGSALLGSTLMGGSQDEGVNGTVSDTNPVVYTATKHNYGDDARGEVMVDDAGNIYVAACTRSGNMPTPGNPFQSSRGGAQDGCLMKFNSSLTSLQWASYLGGVADDAAFSVKLDGSGNLFVAGGTASIDFPISGNSFNGFTDGFIAKVSNNGSSVLDGVFVGTNAYDQVYLLEIDTEDDIYVVGQTEGNWPIVNPAAGPVYQNPGAKQFIRKYNNSLNSIVYSTVFGRANRSVPQLSPTALLVDRCDNVYVTGWGGITNNPDTDNTNNMPLTNDAIQGTTDGSDFYLIVLSRDAQSLEFGTYFGGNDNGFAGDHVDGGTSRFDKNGVVYHAVCASCGGNDNFPTTPGVVSTTNNASNCNLALFKIAFDLAGIEAAFTPLDQDGNPLSLTTGCAPLTVSFDNNSQEGSNPGSVSYLWDFDFNGDQSGQKEPLYTFTDPGTYEVMLIINDPTSCNIADTTFRMIEVFPPPPVEAGPDVTICAGDTITLSSPSLGNDFRWSPSSGIIGSDSVATVQASVQSTTDFILTLTDNRGCIGMDTVRVNVNASFTINARPDTTVCRGGSAPLSVNAPSAVLYEWTSNPAASISDPSIANPFVSNLDTTTFFYIRSENALGCEDFDTVRIAVFEVFTLEDTFVCRDNSIVLASSNAITYQWGPNDGTLSDLNAPSPIASPDVTTVYTVTATSDAGCISVKDIEVEVKERPVADAGADRSICVGQEITLQGGGGFVYEWSPGTGLSATDVATPLASPDETITYTLIVADQFGCADTASTTLTVNPLPDVNAAGDDTICEGDETQLQATGALNYEWTPIGSLSNPSISNPIASPSRTTTYIVSGRDGNGCTARDTVIIEVVQRPVTEIVGVNRICTGGAIELTASGGDTYTWNTGATTPLIEVIPNGPTTYTATAFIGSCEGTPASITVDQRFDFPEAIFDFTPERGFAPMDVQFTNQSTGASRYEWNFGLGGEVFYTESPSFTFPSAGEFVVTLIAYSESGCPDTATGTVFLDNVTLHVPSGITPNGDNVNDGFRVGYVGIVGMEVRIYSRWGPEVFSSDNPDFIWDATYKGKAVPEGVYIYVINAVGENNVEYQRSGTLTVVR